ncbi:MAG: MmgE/PrpD family protein [Candidatus Korobacteraceae bacterium]
MGVNRREPPGHEGAVLSQAHEMDSTAGAADLTRRLASYMVAARDQSLPPKILVDAKRHILDTLAAMVSGARLKPGEMAISFVRTQGGMPEASILTTDIKTSAINAALINGMFSHADETDDYELVTKTHPGTCVVPAAFAMAEREDRSGMELIRAVALGYDLCCRFLIALGPNLVRAAHRSVEGPSSTIGSMAAAASLARLDETGMHYALSYAAQQVSGLWSWVRDSDHIEKAFDFTGMGSRNGISAVVMVQHGFTGVRDILTGEHNVLDALSTKPQPEEMVAGLGSVFYVSETAIKTFSVGYPIQSALDAFLTLRREHGLREENVERVVVRLPEDAARIVNNRAMPDVNCQYNIAVALLEGGVSFVHSHSQEHMADPKVRAVMGRVQLVPDRELMVPEAPRSALVEVTLRDGRKVTHFTRFAPGTKQNPLDTKQVNAKARELMTPVLGTKRTEAVIERVTALEEVRSMRELIRSLLTV